MASFSNKMIRQNYESVQFPPRAKIALRYSSKDRARSADPSTVLLSYPNILDEYYEYSKTVLVFNSD